MIGQRVGYIRVSSLGQNPERQLDGIELDRCFTDTASGKDINRPEFTACMAFVREGDILIVHSMDRLARNLDDLRKIVQLLTGRGVKVQFIKENMVFSGDREPIANLMLSVMGAFAEFERTLIKERQLEGIALAKARGVYKGRSKALNARQIALMQDRLSAGVMKSKIARELNISRETLYKYIRGDV